MKNREEIEAIALDKYPDVEFDTTLHRKIHGYHVRNRKSFIEGYEQAQNELQWNNELVNTAKKVILARDNYKTTGEIYVAISLLEEALERAKQTK